MFEKGLGGFISAKRVIQPMLEKGPGGSISAKRVIQLMFEKGYVIYQPRE